jgi:hypothetical protein
VENRLARAVFPIVTIGSLARRLQYGCSKRAHLEPVGLPILRMSNMQPDGWDLTELKYVELADKEKTAWLLERGDILFNRTNSKELVGKCEVFDEPGEWVFASYLMRLTIDPEVTAPEFVSAFLSGLTGRSQIERDSRQIIGMTNINAEEIRALRIPLPDMTTQAGLLADLDAARAARDARLAAAEAEIAGLDAFVLGELGLSLGPAHAPIQPSVCACPLFVERAWMRNSTPRVSANFANKLKQVLIQCTHSRRSATRWCPASPLGVRIRPRLPMVCHICVLLISQQPGR